ncbi:MAG: hypothetical protein ABS44_10925 [Chryseobacterium sp. SCN 40-13]|nr:MAG: hypothetical protein ABS44_10925 [Chryseobacterium sp. SCN 40-13]
MKQIRNDISRLQDLLSYQIMHTREEECFNELAQLVSFICDVPAGLITFIDDKVQWYKAKVGTENTEVPYEQTICQYALIEDDLLEIPNTLEDARLLDNPNVQQENGVRFYIGVPLRSASGHIIGTVCAFDMVPKTLTKEQKESLKIVARQTMHLLELTKRNRELENEISQILEEKIEKAQVQIRQVEEAYKTLFRAIDKSNPVIEFSPEGKILYVNRQYEEILGYTSEELIGMPHSILLMEEDLAHNTGFWEALQQGEFQSGIFRRLHKDGSVLWIYATYSPVLNENDEVIKVTKIARNITLEIAANENLQESKRLADELSIQKDRFIANMSHEIRTPINAILGFTEILLEVETEEKKLNYLKSVKNAGDNLLYLVNDILDFSKIESGHFQAESKTFPLRNTIKNTFYLLEVSAKKKDIIYQYFIEEDVPDWISGDRLRLSQILLNLLNNAIKFTAEGEVSLRVSLLDNSTLKFDIHDTGIGIPEDQIATIFDRFRQAEESTSRKYGGTGLGLNISKQLVEKQNGRIWVKSELGKGSAFSFILPFEKAEDNTEDTEEKKESLPNLTLGIRVLLCEDNELNQKLMRALFTDTNYLLDIAENGIKGLELLRNNSYDLILMDIQMPEMDGYETTRIIRNEMKLNLPIIAITAHSTENEKEKCLKIGMNECLSKPFQKKVLFDLIHYWSNQPTIADHENREVLTSEVPVLQLDYLKEISVNDDAFIASMLETFTVNSVQSKENMQKAIEENDAESIRKTVHSLKSSFGVIGSDDTLLQAIESQIILQEDPSVLPLIMPLLEQLFQRIDQINEEISFYLSKKS